MPGVNLLGQCERYWESVQNYTSLSISFSLEGVLTTDIDLPAGGTSNSITTLSYSRSFNWNRIPFNGSGYYTSNRPTGNLWIAQEECCCPCRYSLIISNEGENSFSFQTGVTAHQTITDTPGGGGSPTEQQFTISGTVFGRVDFKVGVQQTTGPANRIPCKHTVEGNRNLMFTSIDYTNNFFPTTIIEQEDYSQSLVADGAGVYDDAGIPGVLEAVIANNPCEGMSFSAVSTWSATKSEGNVSESHSVTCILSTTLA